MTTVHSTADWDETVARIKRDVERELLEKELQRLRHGPPDAPVEYMLRVTPVVRMTRREAERMALAEHAEGVRHQLRTRETVLDFLLRHGLRHEVLEEGTTK